jgi:hypothetical protein
MVGDDSFSTVELGRSVTLVSVESEEDVGVCVDDGVVACVDISVPISLNAVDIGVELTKPIFVAITNSVGNLTASCNGVRRMVSVSVGNINIAGKVGKGLLSAGIDTVLVISSAIQNAI